MAGGSAAGAGVRRGRADPGASLTDLLTPEVILPVVQARRATDIRG